MMYVCRVLYKRVFSFGTLIQADQNIKTFNYQDGEDEP